MSLSAVWPTHSKWLSEQSNESASDFVWSFNIPPWKLFRWFRRLQLWATWDLQLHTDNAPTHASHLLQSFLVKHQITQVTQPPYNPDSVPCNFRLFLKLKSSLKGKTFQTTDEIQKNMFGSPWRLGELCEVPKCLLWRGLRCHCLMYKVSCVSYLLQQISLFFILYY